jgi:DNA mismatch endonuclease, patch repair protein
MDTVTPETRSRMMRAVRGKNTKPELIVRGLAHELGFRFRLHRTDLPGTPDLVFSRLYSVILVHGCFWHRHRGCAATTTPKDNAELWAAKFRRNVERDRTTVRALRALGWQVLIVWECQTRDAPSLRQKLKCYLEKQNTTSIACGYSGQLGPTVVDVAKTASTRVPNTRAGPPRTSTPHSRLPSS